VTLLRLCVRAVARRPLRSGLTVAGTGVGIGALVTLLGLAGGLATSWQRLYAERSVDLVVLNARDADFLQSRVPEAVLEGLLALPEVLDADGSLVDLTSYDGVTNTFISGRRQGGFLLEGLRIVEGRPLGPLPEALFAGPPDAADPEDPSRPPAPRHPAEREILIGTAFAAGSRKGVGDIVLIEDEPFRVAGVYRAPSLLEGGGGVVHLRALQRFELREGELTSIEIRLRDESGHAAVSAWLAEHHPGLAAQRPAEMLQESFGLELVQAMAWLVSVLALGVGLVGTSNTMLMSVLEQRRQFGILRALGWKRRRILALVAGETLVLSSLAYGAGCLLGAAATGALARMPAFRNILEPRLDLSVLGLALACTAVLTVGAALVPAWRATRIAPLEAMRLP
jgi:putative ABC transport system permease protein